MEKSNSLKLKSDKGKLVTVKNVNGKMGLCVEDVQSIGEEHKVYIWSRRNKKQVAFGWKCGTGDYYFPKVVKDTSAENKMKDKLELVRRDVPDALPESYWFEKVNNRREPYYGLKSVVASAGYLVLSDAKQHLSISNTADDPKCVYVNHESIE